MLQIIWDKVFYPTQAFKYKWQFCIRRVEDETGEYDKLKKKAWRTDWQKYIQVYWVILNWSWSSLDVEYRIAGEECVNR